ncbi:hypothetical protein CKA32_002271 [Geitlerinema sp. FC II]|nr:hypothetical protein CKA32_002271 [Geitlerinema sp. FC II]
MKSDLKFPRAPTSSQLEYALVYDSIAIVYDYRGGFYIVLFDPSSVSVKSLDRRSIYKSFARRRSNG